MGFSCSPSLCLSCPFTLCCFCFHSLWDLPIALLRTSDILLSPCSLVGLRAPQPCFGLPLDVPSQTQARPEGWFPLWGVEGAETPMGPSAALWGFAGVRSWENIPQHPFPLYFVSPSSFQALKVALGELFAGTHLLLGTDQWLGGERCY